MSAFTTHRPERRRTSPGLFAASTLSAAVAAMALVACGPRDGAANAAGTPVATAPATVAQTPTAIAPNAPGVAAANEPVAMAPVPLQGRPVPTAQVAAAPAYQGAAPAYPTTSPVYPADAPQMQPVPMTAQPQPTAAPPVRVAQAVPSGRVGSIEGIEPIRERPQGSGAGAVIGGVLGAVVGNQFGHGLGRAAMTGVGVAGGAVAGNNIERNYKEGVVGYRVSVRLDNGSSRTFERTSVGGLHVGDRVRVESSGSFHRV